MKRPTRRDVNLILNISLPILLIVSFLSGWAASLLGLTEFGLHKYSSIAAFVVAGGHAALHWRSLAAQMKRLRGGPREVQRRPSLQLVQAAAEYRARAGELEGLRRTGS